MCVNMRIYMCVDLLYTCVRTCAQTCVWTWVTSLLFMQVNADSVENALNSSESLGKVLANQSLVGGEAGWGGGLRKQLKQVALCVHACGAAQTFDGPFDGQVAKLIKARGTLLKERQVFFVKTGGYDTHHKLVAIDSCLHVPCV